MKNTKKDTLIVALLVVLALVGAYLYKSNKNNSATEYSEEIATTSDGFSGPHIQNYLETNIVQPTIGGKVFCSPLCEGASSLTDAEPA